MAPRYITPTKLALLCLIDLYITTDFSATARHEILNFLASRTIIRSDFDSDSLNERFRLSTSDDISVFADVLSKLPSNVPGRHVYDVFLTRIWSLDGLDAVFGLIKHVAESVSSKSPGAADEEGVQVPKISRASPLGQFIRRSNVEFTRLQFADAQALWSAFAAFRSSSHSVWAARNPDAAQQMQSSQQPSWAQSSQPQTSTEDTSLLLTFSIHHLQKLGHRLPSELKANLASYIDQNLDSSSQSLQHFLAFFEHWRSGQYTMALESLHRYYDYSLASHGPGAGREGNRDANGGANANGGMRVYYQYALLHLSVLHADFERWEASVAAMEECVATARESQDTPCLLLALSWLLYLRQAHANSTANDTADIGTSFGNLAISSSTQADEIVFLKTKAREMKYWSLLSSTLLDEGRGELASGNATPKALEHLLQAQYLNTTHDLRTQTPATLLFQAAAMDRLGQSTLSHQTYTSILLLHATHIPLPERVRAGCRLALSHDRRGEFSKAIATLDELEAFLDRGPGTLKSRQRVLGWRMVICLRRELRRNDTPTATRYNNELTPFLSLSGDPDLNAEIFALGIELKLKQNRRGEALAAVNERIHTVKTNPSSDIQTHLHLMLLKCRIFTSPSPSSPTSPTIAPKAFSLALRVASTAQRVHLVPILCEAIGVLGTILNVLGEFAAARGLIEGALPLALECHNAPLVANLYIILTDSLVGLSTSPTPTTSSPVSPAPDTKLLSLASTLLDLAHATYTKLEDYQGQLDCLIKKELLAGAKDDAVGAEKARAMFVQLIEEREREVKEGR